MPCGADPRYGLWPGSPVRTAYYGKGEAELAEGDQQGQIFSVILKALLAKGSVCRMGEIGAGDENLIFTVIQEQIIVKVYKICYVIQGPRL